MDRDLTSAQSTRWLAAKALLGGLGLAVGGAVIWSALAATNLATSPAVPWSVALMAVGLAFGWRLVRSRVWLSDLGTKEVPAIPKASAAPISYGLASVVGLLGLALLLATHRMLSLPLGSLPSQAAQIPLQSLLYFAMASFVAALSEEAGLRGWMQSGLTIHLGRTKAYAIVACCFTLLHAASPAFLYLIPIYFALSLAYSWIVTRWGSIWPVVAGHFVADFASFCFLMALSFDRAV